MAHAHIIVKHTTVIVLIQLNLHVLNSYILYFYTHLYIYILTRRSTIMGTVE